MLEAAERVVAPERPVALGGELVEALEAAEHVDLVQRPDVRGEGAEQPPAPSAAFTQASMAGAALPVPKITVFSVAIS